MSDATGKLLLLRAGDDVAVAVRPLAAGEVVPVNGTELARRAADLALAIARPQRARLKALYVAPRTRGMQGRASLSHRREEAALKDVADLAERYDVPVETAMRATGVPAEAILREAAKGAALLVMGVTQRSGDELFFGDTASAVLAGSIPPVLLVAGERVRRDDAAREAERSGKSDSATAAKETAS